MNGDDDDGKSIVCLKKIKQSNKLMKCKDDFSLVVNCWKGFFFQLNKLFHLHGGKGSWFYN